MASQVGLHQRYGGVVPEIASRAHVRQILPMIDEALRRAGVTLADLGAVAVATRPGLVGALVVGLTAAKALALALEIPLDRRRSPRGPSLRLPARLSRPRGLSRAWDWSSRAATPAFISATARLECEFLGGTTDDAAGEAFERWPACSAWDIPAVPRSSERPEEGNPSGVCLSPIVPARRAAASGVSRA